MIKFKKVQATRLSYLPLITLFLSQTLAGYQQGSYFLFHLTDGSSEKAIGGRIAISVSEIKAQSTKAEATPETQPEKSEFQVEITSLQSAKKDTQLLKEESTETAKEAQQTESTFGESSFGESDPAPGGFFFTY